MKERSRLFFACSQQLHTILAAAIKGWSIRRWLQTRLNFLVCTGCLKDITAMSSKRPRSAFELVAIPPSTDSVLWALSCNFTVEQTLSAFILHHRTCWVTRCSPDMAQRSQRSKCFLEWNTYTVSKLHDICIIYNIHSNRRTEERKVLDDYYHIGFPSEWLLTGNICPYRNNRNFMPWGKFICNWAT